jgi:predicted DNA-binding protein
MKNVTVRLSEEQVETLDVEADDLDLSRAEYIRDLIEKGRESDKIRRELEETQNKVADLRRQLQAVNARQEDVTELVEYVEQQRDLTRYQERRQRQLDEANILTRWKWKVTGVPVESTDNPSAD